MSLYNGPPRGGSRGGRDQFNWEAVKADKDRECYLGHSVKALTGRWQKGKDVYWYTREKGAESHMSEELRLVKEREEQLMAEALGLKPKASVEKKRKLAEHEMQQLLQRSDGAAAGGSGGEDHPVLEDIGRVKGLGYAPRAMGGVAGREVLEGYDDLAPARARADGALPGPPDPSTRQPPPGSHDRQVDGGSPDDLREARRAKHAGKDKSDKKRRHKDKDDRGKRSKKHKKDKQDRRESREPARRSPSPGLRRPD